ncbi:MAG: YibE/F family protein [Mobilitalea sp.]
MKEFIKNKSKFLLPIIISLILLVILVFIPTGFEAAIIYQGTDRTVGKVLETDNSMLLSTGLIQSGEQVCRIELKGGRFKGQVVNGINMLNGSLEQDKLFAIGDKALVVISYQENEIKSVNMIDQFRISKEIIVISLFVVLLIAFAGWAGIRALLSFLVTILMIWKILIPGYLNGNNPVVLGIIITLLLTIITVTLVYGFDLRSLSSISGAVFGTLTTAILGILFTDLFQIHGAIMPYSESLLYSGYSHLDLTKIFMASIFIGSAGAVMDLSVDITSAVHEVVEKKPNITWKEAAISGIHVGKAAIGTQTTTLLLAYSGGYVALLMVFMAQGTPISNILNYKYVAAEILDTIIGSIGLVTVAPFTALTSGVLLTLKRKK